MKVTSADLERMSSLHAVLGVLSDPTAPAGPLAEACEQIPALKFRILELAIKRTIAMGKDASELPLSRALTIVGNREMERIFLDVLEELTVLKFDLEDERNNRVRFGLERDKAGEDAG